MSGTKLSHMSGIPASHGRDTARTESLVWHSKNECPIIDVM